MGSSRDYETGLAALMQFSPMYITLMSSIAICLLLTALILVGFLLQRVRHQHRRPFFTTSLLPRSDYVMSTSQDTKETRPPSPPKSPPSPPPPPGSTLFEPKFPDPLGYVYYPVTSGQLADLADKQEAAAAEQESNRQQGLSPESGSTTATDEARTAEANLMATIRYYEDPANNEVWQRRTVHFSHGNQNVT